MSAQPAVELPAELEPQLQFDSDGVPLIYSRGNEQLRDREAVLEYLGSHSNRFSIGALIFAILAPVSLAAIVATVISTGIWLGPVVPGILVPIYLLVISGQFREDAFSEKRIQPLRDLRAVRRRRLFRSWAENNLKTAQSEEELDELQDRMGALRLEQEKRDSLQVGARSAGPRSSSSSGRPASTHDIVPYWMGGPAPEAQKAPEKPQTIDKPVMS